MAGHQGRSVSGEEEEQKMPGSLGWGPGEEKWFPAGALLPWAKHPTFCMWLLASQVTPGLGRNHFSQERKEIYKIKKVSI